MSYFKKIAQRLKKRIVSGEFKTQLPTQQTLALEYQTSRVTISKAIQLLKIEGWVTTSQRRGTFIRPERLAHYPYETAIDSYDGGSVHYGALGKVQTEIIAFAIQSAEFDQAEQLQINPGDDVYEIIRLRTLDGRPVVLEYTVMPVALIPNLTPKVLHESIYDYIQKDLGLKIGPASRRLRADLADVYDQKYLQCGVNTPILEMEQVVFLDDITPFEFSQARHPHKLTEFIYTAWEE